MDDSQSLHRKWLFHQTTIYKWLFGVPGIYPSKIEWDRIPTDPGPSKLRDRAMIDTQVFSGSIQWALLEISWNIRISWNKKRQVMKTLPYGHMGHYLSTPFFVGKKNKTKCLNMMDYTNTPLQNLEKKTQLQLLLVLAWCSSKHHKWCWYVSDTSQKLWCES